MNYPIQRSSATEERVTEMETSAGVATGGSADSVTDFEVERRREMEQEAAAAAEEEEEEEEELEQRLRGGNKLNKALGQLNMNRKGAQELLPHVVDLLNCRETFGSKGYSSCDQIPSSVRKRLNEREGEMKLQKGVETLTESLKPIMSWFCCHGKACKGMHSSTKELYELGIRKTELRFSHRSKREDWFAESLRALERIRVNVCEIPANINPDDLTPDLPLAFILYGGAQLLIDFFLCTIPKKFGGRGQDRLMLRKSREQKIMHRIWVSVLDTFRELCVAITTFRHELALNEELVLCLIKLLQVPQLFDFCLNVVEELLASMSCCFKLEKLTNFESLIASFSTGELAKFCRLLALTLHNREDFLQNENPRSLGLLRYRCKSACKTSSVQENHRFICSSPILIPRLVHVLRTTQMQNSQTNRNSGNNTTGTEATEQDQQEEQEEEESELNTGELNTNDVLQLFQQVVSTQDPLRRRNLTDLLSFIVNEDPSLMAGILGNGSRNNSVWKSMPPKIPIEDIQKLGRVDAFNIPEAALSQIQIAQDDEFETLSPRLTAICQEYPAMINHVDCVLKFMQVHAPMQRREIGARLRGNNNNENGEDERVGGLLRQQRLVRSTQQIEVLFVLSVLAGGRYKDEAIAELATNNLPKVLDDLFYDLDWKEENTTQHEQGVHGENCECSPSAAQKIQFLRLVHNFCDRDSDNRCNNSMLLGEVDMCMCKLFTPSLVNSSSIHAAQEILKSAGSCEPSLMKNLVDLLISQKKQVSHTFWLVSTIESFLHGHGFEKQMLLTSWGLMDELILRILGEDNADGGIVNPDKDTSMLQVNFDLLGALIKFNQYQFAYLCSIVSESQFKALVQLSLSHLIDSNVFIRTVILSLDYFRSISLPRDLDFCFFEKFLCEHQITILRRLMTVVTLEKVSQENICCINTALVILVSSYRQGLVEIYLKAVESSDPLQFQHLLKTWRCKQVESIEDEKDDICRAMKMMQVAEMEGDNTKAGEDDIGEGRNNKGKDKEDSSGSPGNSSSTSRLNFRRLLWFWRQYYLSSNEQDRQNLESSSRIPFEDWIANTDRLCADDGSETSLLRHGETFDLPCMLDLLSSD